MDGITADKIALLKIKDNGNPLLMPYLDNNDVKAGFPSPAAIVKFARELQRTQDFLKPPAILKNSGIVSLLNSNIIARNLISPFHIPNHWRKEPTFLQDLFQVVPRNNIFQRNNALIEYNNFAFKPLVPTEAYFEEAQIIYLEVIKSDYYEFLENLDLSAFEETEKTKAPVYLTEAQLAKSIIEEVWINNQHLYEMKPREFERMTAELLRNQGFEVQLTKETRDGGYDLYAIYKMAGQHPIKMLVECKRYSPENKIGIDIVRSFRTVINEQKANKGLIVTTSYLSSDAKKSIAETPYLLDGKDRNDILQWVQDYKGIIIS
ncbi:MAG: restriction endonuclease [Chitinophagaceae bacterium]|jgi:hypothetical protein